MQSIFQINPELNIPIYRQLVDSIRAAVKKGALQDGQQLPTIWELPSVPSNVLMTSWSEKVSWKRGREEVLL